MANPKKNLSKRVVHLELPVKMWTKFLHWCVDNGYGNLTEGIKATIRKVIEN
jgi:hypothetical protein